MLDAEIALVADARLDNRAELMAELGSQGAPPTDAQLIIQAYARWGTACPQRLLGDFAFAIWDARRQRLFCARDHLGVKPLYFHESPTTFAFASEAKALLALPFVDRSIDENRVADYVASLVPDDVSTFHLGMARLAPHHSLAITGTKVEKRAFWSLEPAELPVSKNHVEAFRELFVDSVRLRLQDAEPVGAMLSGGLDSSSIALVAASIVARDGSRAMPTFSLTFDASPELGEDRFIDAALARGHFRPLRLVSADYAPFAGFDAILAEQDEPFLAPGLAAARMLYRAAASQGVRVLLDGHGGDEVVSHGLGRLNELALSGRWAALWRESRGIADLYGDRPWPIFAAHLSLHPLGRRLMAAKRALRIAPRAAPRKRDAARAAWRFDMVNPDLMARTGLAERARAQHDLAARSMLSEALRHKFLLSYGLRSHAFEVLDKAAAGAGVDARYPFWDKRLVEFCLALPSEAKLDRGWSRLILRKSMEGILPREIQWRRDKLDFGVHLVRGMLNHHRTLLDRVLLDDAEGVGDYVNLAAAKLAYRRVVEAGDGSDGQDVQLVWRAVTLATWLAQVHGRDPRRPVGGNDGPQTGEDTPSASAPIHSRERREIGSGHAAQRGGAPC